MNERLTGLTDAEVEKSRRLHGTNSLSRAKSKGFFGKFLENLSDPIIRILLIALGIQIALTLGNCNYIEIGGILAAILISTTVSTASEYRSERAFAALEEESLSGTASVLRNGRLVQLPIADLAVGDIVYITAGEKVPADGIVIDGCVSVDQSALNGEGIEVTKEPSSDRGWELSAKGRIFRGSQITDGSAVMRVGRVGESTYYGMVAKDVQAETRISPLKLRLTDLAAQISRIGYVAAALVGISFLFAALVVDNGFSPTLILETLKDTHGLATILIRALTMMITVIVVAAPEGLPMMITVVLSANMKRMLTDSILVKKLVGIETAGSMNILFTDKTGTITEGHPTCERIITAEGTFHSLSKLADCGEIYRTLVLSAKYNTDVLTAGSTTTGGNATDRAIFSYFENAEVPAMAITKKEPFSSERKLSRVTLSDGTTLIKGAAEILMSGTEYVLTADGSSIPIGKTDLRREYYGAVGRGERVLAVLRKGPDTENSVIVGLIVLKDKVRAGVKDAVARVTGAGIQTVMITGDGKDTAVAIAKECGIMRPEAGHIALGSDELRAMTDAEVKAILPKLRVVSRALPTDKTRLVRLSQELNLVVGMTGDGINDAPSLKLSDVGFSMGSGTDIAKSASDIVILDDSFSAISKTVLYGRTIFKSIRKFITFQLIMNLAACGISLCGQFIGVDTPITIIQMLWVNIIMDTLGGLAFAGEPPLDYYMMEKPKRRDEPILTREMLHHVFLSGAFTLMLCIVFFTAPRVATIYHSADKLYTAFYALFIFAGLFNCFGARCERLWLLSNIGKNKPFVLIMLAISVIQILMIFHGGAVFRCVPLESRELLFAVGMAFTVVPFDILRRIFYKLK